MEALVQEALATVQAKARTWVPWKADEKWPQKGWIWKGEEWVEDVPGAASQGCSRSYGDVTRLAVYSWNVDFMLPFADARMRKAIGYLRELVEADGSAEAPTTATVVFLQECVAGDLELLQGDAWVRERFALTDVGIGNWQSGHYGTVTLVDQRLEMADIFRVHYSATRFERDALFVDVRLGGGNLVRLCNTHLESLALEPPFRVPQMKLCASYMRDGAVDGAIAAGDFNAIQDFDRTLHEVNGLKDAFIEQGGREGDPKGHTWGQQAATSLRERFGTSRMDKVYFAGSALALEGFSTFGADVCVDDAREKEEIVKLGFDRAWITDHLGVKAIFCVAPTRESSAKI